VGDNQHDISQFFKPFHKRSLQKERFKRKTDERNSANKILAN